MISVKSGVIINMSSIAGKMGVTGRGIYGTTKAAVLGLTKGIAADYVQHGVRCNAISPGPVVDPDNDDPDKANPVSKWGFQILIFRSWLHI